MSTHLHHSVFAPFHTARGVVSIMFEVQKVGRCMDEPHPCHRAKRFFAFLAAFDAEPRVSAVHDAGRWFLGRNSNNRERIFTKTYCFQVSTQCSVRSKRKKLGLRNKRNERKQSTQQMQRVSQNAMIEIVVASAAFGALRTLRALDGDESRDHHSPATK